MIHIEPITIHSSSQEYHSIEATITTITGTLAENGLGSPGRFRIKCPSIQGHERNLKRSTMSQYPVDRIFTRSKSRRWKQVRAGAGFLIVAVLALATCAWVSLIFTSQRHCFHTSESWSSTPIFPWESPQLDEQRERDSSTTKWPHRTLNATGDLNISHLLFGIAGAAPLWPTRKEYVKLWWKPEEMRGFVWLEDVVKTEPDEPLPKVMVSEDISRFSYAHPTGHPAGIRLARIVQEAFKLKVPGIRWFVMGDDDTVFAVSNLLKVLRKYDYRELYYIGNPSESHSSNTYFSHGMGFGGGGIAISYPLAEALSNMLDECMERYPFLFGSDDRLHACITELGVPLTKEQGFHQFDVHGNAFGLLAAHPVAPFISIHHLDEIDPFFPNYNFLDGLRHLTMAMQMEPTSFLQRCICYDQEKRLTFSVSSGYVVQVYPYIFLPRDLERPEITFKAWNKKDEGGEFDFDTRPAIRNVCDKPFLFYLERNYLEGETVIATYKRDIGMDDLKKGSNCPPALLPDNMQQIRVISRPMSEHWFKVPRRQCCKVMASQDQDLTIHVDSCQVGRAKTH